jgi:hypothetical protein
MAITELALLKLKDGVVLTDKFKPTLREAQQAMEDYSGQGRKFYYLQQIEDPSCIYVLGEWESLEQHYQGFIPSKTNQDLLEALKDKLDVVWLNHLDIPLSKVPLSAPVLSLGRHMVAPELRANFTNCFDRYKHHVESYVTEGAIAHGWNIDEGREREEFVLFAPWKEVLQHVNFASEEGFKEYAKIKDFMEDAEVKHVQILDI